MPRSLADDPDHWRQRGEEIRMLAEGMEDPKPGRSCSGSPMINEELAERAEIRTKRRKPPK